MKGRDILKGMVGASEPTIGDTEVQSTPHRPAGPVRAINRSLARLSEEASAAKVLRDSIAAGDKVVELDPSQVEASFMRDRMELERDDAYTELKASIDRNGQQVPILVRQHPDDRTKYQAAYGHRRLQAARDLGRPVRAIVKALTDGELILAQGQENSGRVDLSFIERARYALNMEQHGLSRDQISAVLSIDNPEVSRLLGVAQSVPDAIVVQIGPAPKVGRPRWVALAAKLSDKNARKSAAKAAASESFATLDTNKRFEQVWAAVTAVEDPSKELKSIKNRKGYVLGSVKIDRKGMKLTISSIDFADFLSAKLVSLVEEFDREKGGKTNE
jgi:ParB family chromosome partitioning protein